MTPPPDGLAGCCWLSVSLVDRSLRLPDQRVAVAAIASRSPGSRSVVLEYCLLSIGQQGGVEGCSLGRSRTDWYVT